MQDAVKKLNYIPNMNARLLKANKKNTIGLFVENVQGGFYNMLIQAIHIECKRQGYLLNIYVCNENESQEVYSMVASSGVAAAIVINTLSDNRYVERLLSQNMPLVFLDRDVNGCNLSSCVISNYDGVALGMEYLIQKGNKKIGYVHGLDNYDNSNRYQAYLETLEKHHLKPYESFVIRGEFDPDKTYEEMCRILASGTPIPDAMFCASDQNAFGCIKALRENGIRVPRDISVMGFDDEEVSQYYIPPLTTVHSPIKELGTESAREAIRLASGDRLEGKHIELPARLAIRESVL